MAILVICSLFYMFIGTAQMSNNEIRLQKDKLLEYNRNVVPKFNESTPISVHLSMYPMNIIRFNEREELLYVNIFLLAFWQDHNIAWDPRLYGNITSTLFKQSQLWLPDMVLGMSKEKMQPIGFDDLNVHVESTGHVDWEPGISAEIICSVDTTYIPFDEQTCVVPITTWMHSPSMVRFVSSEGSGVNTSVFIDNGQWELMELTATKIEEHEYYSVVDFAIRLKRRTAYYVTSLIIPVVTVSVLNCFVFLIPRDSGERLSYGMTTFLSYMVLLTLTTDNLPKTSKQRPVFVVYLTCMLGLSLFSVVCSVLTIMFPARPSKSSAKPTESSTIPSDSLAKIPNCSAKALDSSARQSESTARPLDSSTMPPDSSARPSGSSARSPNSSTRPPDSSARPSDSSNRADDHRDIEASAGNNDWDTTEYRNHNIAIARNQETQRVLGVECSNKQSSRDIQRDCPTETLDEFSKPTNGPINAVQDGPGPTMMLERLQKCLGCLIEFDLGMFVVVSCATIIITWVALYTLVANQTKT